MVITTVILTRRAERISTFPVGNPGAGFTAADQQAAKDKAASWAAENGMRILDSHYSLGEYKFWVERKDAWKH